MGKGGVSGEVKFPDYLETLHKEWLYDQATSSITVHLEDAMDTAFGADPYASYAYSNPSSDLAVIQTDFDTFYSAVSTSVTTTDFITLLDAAQARADTCDIDSPVSVRNLVQREIELATNSLEEAVGAAKALIDQDIIGDLVTAFEAEQSRTRELRVGRYSQAMADVGALRSSAFLTGLGAIYAQEQEDTDKFSAQQVGELFQRGIQAWVSNYTAGLSVDQAISALNKNARQGTMLASLQTLAQFYQRRLEWLARGAQLQSEITKQSYIMTNEYEKLELDLDIQSALWDFEVFGKGISIVGALSGYAHPIPNPGKSSVLGGALGGASVGAAFGPPGAGIGAIVGAGLSLLG